MTAGTSSILICQRALADIGTRSSITGLDLQSFPNALNLYGQESAYCSLYYAGIKDHILRAANWNFAKRTTALQLWKALPGTSENPTQATISGWSPLYPAPPWTFSYILPSDCLRARALIGQPQQVPIAPPIFSGSTGTNPPISQRLPMARFEVASDLLDNIGQQVGQTYGVTSVSITATGAGHRPGDIISLVGGSYFGVSTFVQVDATFNYFAGNVSAVNVLFPGTYQSDPIGLTLLQAGTTGNGVSLSATVIASAPNQGAQTVLLTNQEFPVLEYTYEDVPEVVWDAMFEEAMIAGLAARLAQALTGDKALARDKYNIANNIITNARVMDGNEGLTINDHVPDWIRTRGAGGGLGYEAFFYPLGPLFPVAPLV